MFASEQTISAFLSDLVETFPREGILYVVGESSLVLEGKRPYCSEIIVALEIDGAGREDFRRAVDAAASRAGIAVTIEHPGDVIPLPGASSTRSRRVSGFADEDGRLHVRHFDPYTTAIRFIARGDEPDYDLVVAFLEMGWLEMDDLQNEIRVLLPRFSFETIQQDPAEFRRKFKGLTQIWHSRSRVGSDGLAHGRMQV